MMLKKIALSITFLMTTVAYANEPQKNQLNIDLSWLYLKPMSNNHTYAFYVAGTQPYFQDWHAQAVNPNYTSAYELNVQYALQLNQLNIAVDWLHLHSDDSDSKQGNDTTDVTNIEFVGPPFEMSPPVFGVRYAQARLKYFYDDVAINLEKTLDTPQWMSAKIIAGINALYLKQNLTSTFSDLVGAEPTPYTYALPPDPSFSLRIQAISEFIGAGPNLGVSGQIEIMNGLSIIGAAFASINVGTLSVQENFRGTSQTLTDDGIGVSKQAATVPNKIQVVPGFDGKLGLLYQFKTLHIPNFSIEAGYRLIAYMNVISTLNPQTLVQPGDNPGVPEFATGTMAIVSMTQQDRPFNLNGPYVMVKLSFL